MIKAECYGGGTRWYCTECDELYNENGLLTIHFTNSTPPKECSRCGGECMLVSFRGSRPSMITTVLTRKEAAHYQRLLREGTIVSVEWGRELKRGMVNAGV